MNNEPFENSSKQQLNNQNARPLSETQLIDKLNLTELKLTEPLDNAPFNILSTVYAALKEKGYNPVNQIVGYILSGDPTYITGYNNARSLIGKIERDELLEEIVCFYLNNRINS